MRSSARTTVAVILAVVGLQASAEGQGRPKSDRNKLTSEEIRARPSSTVYDLIRSRRPSWLAARGSSTFETRTVQDPFSETRKPMTVPAEPTIIVYVDNVRRGSQEVLRSISTDEVESMERLDAASATQRFGSGHEYGAIVITRRTSR